MAPQHGLLALLLVAGVTIAYELTLEESVCFKFVQETNNILGIHYELDVIDANSAPSKRTKRQAGSALRRHRIAQRREARKRALQKRRERIHRVQLRYSVVVEGRPGEKIVINHDIERIPPTTKRPRSYIVRGPNPILSKAAAARKARLEKLRADWKARRAAFKEKTNELLANRRARLRNMRPPPAV
uniref:Uncharacterized protein n=1 Tax=Anopheles albimanus TaxID=7167 RepID=A0A182FGQ7_ANOAL